MPESADSAAVVKDRIDHLRAGYEAFARGDVGGLVATLDPDVELHNPEYAIEGGVRYGREAFGRAMEGIFDYFEYKEVTTKMEPLGNCVVVEMSARGAGKLSGAPIDATFFHVWAFRDGRGVRFAWFQTKDEALAAVSRLG